MASPSSTKPRAVKKPLLMKPLLSGESGSGDALARGLAYKQHMYRQGDRKGGSRDPTHLIIITIKQFSECLHSVVSLYAIIQWLPANFLVCRSSLRAVALWGPTAHIMWSNALGIFLFLAAKHVSYACVTDEDCSLNGQCRGHSTRDLSACGCDVPWTGPTCGKLLTIPAQGNAAIYGYSPNVSSWGGSIINGDGGTHHLFVAEMRSGGLSGWATNSQCTHAVSTSGLSGPYVKKEVLLSPWCHGPVALREPGGKYLLFHVGQGFLHYSSSLYGPWKRVEVPAPPGGCNMPSAAFHPNGTLYAICSNGHSITSSPSWNVGNWTEPRALHPSGQGGSWEDPHLWFDKRGFWHILYHVYSLKPFQSGVELYSGHGFSRDGIDWQFSDVPPFDGTVQFTDGKNKTYATRERPHLIFSDETRTVPIGVTSAVSSQPLSGPSCDSCVEGACSQCKVTPGRDWTFTVLQPFEPFAGEV